MTEQTCDVAAFVASAAALLRLDLTSGERMTLAAEFSRLAVHAATLLAEAEPARGAGSARAGDGDR